MKINKLNKFLSQNFTTILIAIATVAINTYSWMLGGEYEPPQELLNDDCNI